MRWWLSMATAANLAGIGRRGLLEKIVAAIVAGRAARVVTIVGQIEDQAAAKGVPGMKAVQAAAVAGHLTGSPKSSSRS